MEAFVTYVHHNCFVLELGPRVMVFDWPSAAHRPPGAEDVVRRALAGAEATVFFSHSHLDHCSADILDLVGAARSVSFVLSFDVPDMVPELDPDKGLAGAVVLDPDQPARVGDLAVECLESNDLGVAFLITAPQGRVYFGGDLAQWTWPGLDRAARRFAEDYYGSCLERVRAFAPDIAFADADPRLADWAGGARFWDTVRPGLFVPMHGFGDLAALARFASGLDAPAGRVLTFKAMGERARAVPA